MNDVKTKEIMEKLREPFSERELEWRVLNVYTSGNTKKAIVCPYVTARAIQNRLDDVVGICSWKVSYDEWASNSVKCTLSLRINGEWISKEDGSDNTDIESTKGGFSSALKRAAVLFGIGRYLYYIENLHVTLSDHKINPNDVYARVKFDGKHYNTFFTPPDFVSKMDPLQPTVTEKNTEKPVEQNQTMHLLDPTDSSISASGLVQSIEWFKEYFGFKDKEFINVYRFIFKTNIKTLNEADNDHLQVLYDRLNAMKNLEDSRGTMPHAMVQEWLSKSTKIEIREHREMLMYCSDELLNECTNAIKNNRKKQA
ncbi:Rad52/Rad22 family DNA repair protein [Bacillus mycoides]|uniref:Rad52/Rad22 family DNA repair protein n=1 Tax=Bacillus mycoides TaxID=1405 RepID=UPI001F16C0FE|nr:Rad52/Rad22 family DNA repair protein [Bacillus mycoides]